MARNARQQRRLSPTYEDVAGVPAFNQSGLAPAGQKGSQNPQSDDAPDARGVKLGGDGRFSENDRGSARSMRNRDTSVGADMPTSDTPGIDHDGIRDALQRGLGG